MKVLVTILRFVLGAAVIFFGIRYVTIQFGLFTVDFGGIRMVGEGYHAVPTDCWRVLWGIFVWFLGDAFIAISAAIVVIVGLTLMVSGLAGGMQRRTRRRSVRFPLG